MTEVLQNKYRPTSLDQVVGQDAAVQAVSQIVERQGSQAFLLVGPAGCGKTSIARIIAEMMGVEDNPLCRVETNAGNYNGVDDMRALTDGLHLRPIGGQRKALILNEVQALTKAAWNSILTVMEEPPPWVVWVLTTTEADKVPEAVVTRCTRVEVKPVPWQVLVSDLLRPVADVEGFQVGDDILGMCAREARGSPRQALNNLGTCAQADSAQAAEVLLRGEENKAEGIELARAIWAKKPWPVIVGLIAKLAEDNPEQVRRVIVGYVKTILLNPKNHQNTALAQRGCAVLDEFSRPMYGSEGQSQLLLAAGRLVLLG